MKAVMLRKGSSIKAVGGSTGESSMKSVMLRKGSSIKAVMLRKGSSTKVAIRAATERELYKSSCSRKSAMLWKSEYKVGYAMLSILEGSTCGYAMLPILIACGYAILPILLGRLYLRLCYAIYH
jgi:hypothetical protein